jgi:hypothetical protein
MTVSSNPMLSGSDKRPIKPSAGVQRQYRRRALFARADSLVQQCADFLGSGIARPTGFAQSVAHFVCWCSKEFPFQSVE